MDPLVSIIIPIYKVEQYLHRCVDSVLAQTYKNIEIILVDDGSPDRCSEICDEYAAADKRVKAIHQKNGGLSAARNAGFEACEGEYLYYLDSDDFITSDCIELLYKGIIKTGADVSCGSYKFFFDGDSCDVCRKIKTYDVMDSSVVLRNLLDGKVSLEFAVVWNKLIKKDKVSSIRFPIKKYHEDEYYNWKLYLNTESVCFINQITYMYYQRKSSITGSGFGNHNFDFLGALEERIEYFSTNRTELYPLAVKSYRMSLIDYFYCGINRCKNRKSLIYSKKDIHKMYKESFRRFNRSTDFDLYTCKQKIRNLIFFYLPWILNQSIKVYLVTIKRTLLYYIKKTS